MNQSVNTASQSNTQRTKKVTVDMDIDHKWFISELAYKDRVTEREVLYGIIEYYINDHKDVYAQSKM